MKQDILRLREEGKSYNEIVKLLGCCKSTVCYHCGPGQRIKTNNRVKKCKKKMHPYRRKLMTFIDRRFRQPSAEQYKRSDRHLFTDKVYDFINRNHKNIGETMEAITEKDIMEKFGENPKCYLTGQPIDIYKPRTYNFDHKVPVSRGGTNTLDNLGICTRNANASKADMTCDEYLELCKTVLINHGFTVTK